MIFADLLTLQCQSSILYMYVEIYIQLFKAPNIYIYNVTN